MIFSVRMVLLVINLDKFSFLMHYKVDHIFVLKIITFLTLICLYLFLAVSL